MENQIAVVTGASSGFGLLTSLELAQKGFHVIATMRDMKKGLPLVNQAERLGVKDRIQLFELDVTSNHSITNWKTFMEELGRIDILVNNAGYAGAGFVEEIPVEEYREQFETNVFGVIGVTQAVLSMMRKQRKGRIITISSISGRVGFPGLSPYVSSKHALEGWSESLRLEMKPFGIDVVIIEPGSFQTNIWSSGKRVTENSLKIDSPYYGKMKKLEQHIEKGTNKFGDPVLVAKLIAGIALKKKTSLRYMVGEGVKVSVILKFILPWRLWEKLLLKQLK
ncbi:MULTISPECIES: oxidoreductase [Metabacillus]|uniref:Short-chain dehydrogenase/reductase n=2 Tax=Metabacillus TaxID=2675233 RepID=A0A179SRX9_9BACI|nr:MULTISPECIES: oxidoreductase [Metabacillus]OAS83063.1 short-chain dehydrogenase/reductase [Metabacillus litoralis]QNF27617.1 SDR family oxidoreductase [Metabacillus sp. KUDC1714]